MALDAGVRHIVVDSFDELDRLDALHAGGTVSRPTCCCASRPASTPTPTSTSPPARTTRSSGSTSATATPPGPPSAPSRSSAVNLVGLHCHIGSNVFAAESFGRAAEVMAAFAAPYDLPELVLGGGLGVAYLDGEEAPTITEWAKVVLDACAAAGRALDDQRRTGPRDRRRRRRHRLHRRHDQGDPRRAHVHRRRRRHERQPPAGAVRQRLRVVPAPRRRRRTLDARPASSASTASPATSCCSTLASPPTWPSATCSPSRSPAPTATRWVPTTTRCLVRRSCSSATGRPGSSCAGRRTTTCWRTDVG